MIEQKTSNFEWRLPESLQIIGLLWAGWVVTRHVLQGGGYSQWVKMTGSRENGYREVTCVCKVVRFQLQREFVIDLTAIKVGVLIKFSRSHLRTCLNCSPLARLTTNALCSWRKTQGQSSRKGYRRLTWFGWTLPDLPFPHPCSARLMRSNVQRIPLCHFFLHAG